MNLPPEIAMKYQRLQDGLRPLPSLAVAFSGGVDSALLLAAAVSVLGRRVVALTADSPLHPARETRAAVDIGGWLKVRHVVVRTEEMKQADFRANTRDRCYICKKLIFRRLMDEAASRGIAHLAHGVNQDDLSDYRPGLRAAEEMAVMAPLQDAGLVTFPLFLRISRPGRLDDLSRTLAGVLDDRVRVHVRGVFIRLDDLLTG